MLKKIRFFLTHDLWRIRAKRLPRKKAVPIGFLRVVMLTARQFRKDNCQLRASALTYFTLMSVVPILALAFGIAKGFGLERRFEAMLLRELPSQEEALRRIIGFAVEMLKSAQGGAIAGIGIVFLIWAIIRMLGQIENAFNDIWGVKKGRTLGRKFTDYISLMFLFPITLVLAGSLNVFLAGQLASGTIGALPDAIEKLLIISLPLLSFLVICGLLSFLYVYLPNTPVHIGSGIIGGVSAALVYEAVQWGYIHAQIFFSSYGAVYGSFAALPLFLIWLQLSWMVILLGAELAFAHQNADTYEFEPDAQRASFGLRKVLAMRITALCVERFKRSEPPLMDEAISSSLDIPIRLCRSLIEDLMSCGILSESRGSGDRCFGYQPAMPIEAITHEKIVAGLERVGFNDLPVASMREAGAEGHS